MCKMYILSGSRLYYSLQWAVQNHQHSQETQEMSTSPRLEGSIPARGNLFALIQFWLI